MTHRGKNQWIRLLWSTCFSRVNSVPSLATPFVWVSPHRQYRQYQDLHAANARRAVARISRLGCYRWSMAPCCPYSSFWYFRSPWFAHTAGFLILEKGCFNQKLLNQYVIYVQVLAFKRRSMTSAFQICVFFEKILKIDGARSIQSPKSGGARKCPLPLHDGFFRSFISTKMAVSSFIST